MRLEINLMSMKLNKNRKAVVQKLKPSAERGFGLYSMEQIYKAGDDSL